MFALRLGDDRRVAVTTTPRATPLVKRLVAMAGGGLALTRAATHANELHLAPGFIAAIERVQLEEIAPEAPPSFARPIASMRWCGRSRR